MTSSESESSASSSDVISKPLRKKVRHRAAAGAGLQGGAETEVPAVHAGDVDIGVHDNGGDGVGAAPNAEVEQPREQEDAEEDAAAEGEAASEEEEQEVSDDDEENASASGLEVVTDSESDASDASVGHGDIGAEMHTAEVLQYANHHGCDIEFAEDALEEALEDVATSQDRSFLETCSQHQDRVWDGSEDDDWKPSQSQGTSSPDDYELSADTVVPDLQVRMKFSPPHESGARKRGQLLDCTNTQGDSIFVQSSPQDEHCDDSSSDSDFRRTEYRPRRRGNKQQKRLPTPTAILEDWVSALLTDSTDMEDAFCLQQGRCDCDIVRRTPYKDGSRQGRQRPQFERTAAVRLLGLPFPYYLLNGMRGRIRHVVSPEPDTTSLRRATQKIRNIDWVTANERKPEFANCFLIDVFQDCSMVPTIAILVQQEHLELVERPPRLSRRKEDKFLPAELPHWG